MTKAERTQFQQLEQSLISLFLKRKEQEAKEKGFSFEKEDGNVVVKDSNGNILKDANYSPITVKDWVTTFSTPYLAKVEGGAGKGDDTGEGKAGSFEAFMKESERNSWDASKQNQEMAKRISNGTLKI